MSSDLIIKPLDFDVWEYVAGPCKRRGIELPASYAGDTEDYLLISMIRISSIAFFINYAAGLEGFQGPDAMTKTTFRNLPWWMEAFWVPVDIDPPIVEE